MAAVIGALRVVLGADTASFESGLRNASQRLEAFGKSANLAGAAIGATLGAAVVGLAVSIKKTIDEADKLGKMSQKFGIPVEQLSALKFAADLSDVSIEALANSMARLSKNMVEAAGNAKGTAARAFEAMGISLKNAEGSLKTNSEVLEEIADKFKSYEDGAEKAALAMAVFGKSGTNIIPFLNEGRDGIGKLTDEAKKLGIVIGGQTAKSAQEFNDNLKRLSAVKQSLILQITEHMIPSLEELSKGLVNLSTNSEFAKTAGETIGEAFKGAVQTIAHLMLIMERFPVTWTKLITVTRTPLFTPEFTKAWETFQAQTDSNREAVNKLKESFSDATVEIGTTGRAMEDVGGPKGAAPLIKGLQQAKNALESFLVSQQKSIAGQRAEADAVFFGTGAKEQLKVQYQALTIAAENNIPVTEALRLKIAAVGTEAGIAAMKLEGMKLRFDNQEPLIAMNMELARVEASMRLVGATSDEIGRAQDRVREKFQATWTAIGTSVANFMGSFSQLTGVFAKENKAMGIASKAFGIAQAIINTQVAITKALATIPPPASYVAAAAAAAQGAASIALIAAQGFAKGGSFMVPGGVGGGERLLPPMTAFPGERVTVETPQQQRGGGDGQTIVLKGSSFHFTEVRDLIELISAGLRDGHELKVKRA